MSTGTPQPLPFQARSYMAFVLAPQQPIGDWLANLDASIECSKGIYSHHPVALDMSAANLKSGRDRPSDRKSSASAVFVSSASKESHPTVQQGRYRQFSAPAVSDRRSNCLIRPS